MPAPASRPIFFGFTASWYGFAGRAFGIALLNLVTLGLYKPYGLTRVRRALYGSIHIGPAPLHYEGTARALARVTLYPSLALLVLLLVPAIVQFMTSWQIAVGISVLQLLLLFFYADYLRGLNRQYEVSQLTWRGYSLSLELAPWRYAAMSFFSRWANWLTLGALAPWRRLWLERELYRDLRFGRHAIRFAPDPSALWVPYYVGWLLALAGWVWCSWYGWQHAVVPVQALLAGGAADPAMAHTVDPALFAPPGMGAPGGDTMAQMGTWLRAFTLAFILIPAGILWQQLCLSIYEWRWWQTFCDGLQLQESQIRFDGGWWGLYWRNAIALLLNMITTNLTRPFTSFSRLRFFTHYLCITKPESLEKLFIPPARS